MADITHEEFAEWTLAFKNHLEEDKKNFGEIQEKLDGLPTKQDVADILSAIHNFKVGMSIFNISSKTVIRIGAVVGAIAAIWQFFMFFKK